MSSNLLRDTVQLQLSMAFRLLSQSSSVWGWFTQLFSDTDDGTAYSRRRRKSVNRLYWKLVCSTIFDILTDILTESCDCTLSIIYLSTVALFGGRGYVCPQPEF